MSWWEQPLPQGPAQGPPFIRPLYPPDASSRGKTPSTNGKDVVAVKRGISRAGRWPWGTFDNIYSNGFSHGRSGNVAETGMAGFQRQNGIDPTGWMGEASYQALRTGLVPAGLPHAGEPLLDATAVNMLEQFSDQWKGSTSTVRQAALALSRTFLGYTESPAGTNCNMFGAWYGMNYEPWCAMFASYCYELGKDGGSDSFQQGALYSYCPYVLADAKAGRNGLVVVGEPIPGDLVLYDWEQNQEPDHIGLFETWTGGRTFNAIEGNTSIDNNSNGGEVMRRSRDAATGVTFVRVAER